jgi:hypothetical protein
VSDTDTAVVKSLKVLDPNRPIREADIVRPGDSQPARDLPAYLSLLDSPTDDLHWLTLDPPRRRRRAPGCVVP